MQESPLKRGFLRPPQHPAGITFMGYENPAGVSGEERVGDMRETFRRAGVFGD